LTSTILLTYIVKSVLRGHRWDKEKMGNGELSMNLWFLYVIFHYTVEHAHAVTCIKRSPFSCPVIEHFIWIEPLLRGHLSYKAILSLSQMWSLNTGLTMILMSTGKLYRDQSWYLSLMSSINNSLRFRYLVLNCFNLYLSYN
jgi:hypothetical protein